jgi:RimJ/RimL family protein N-acetyltransferase
MLVRGGETMHVRRIGQGEGEVYRSVRLAALAESPAAFSTTYESAVGRSAESWQAQADGAASGTLRATFLAFSGDLPVGLASVYRTAVTATEAELLQVWIAPADRGSGLARVLVEACLAWAAAAGIQRVVAALEPGNERARKFYAKLGFVAISPDALVMALDLDRMNPRMSPVPSA